MKKIFLLISLLFLTFSAFSYDKGDLYGSWVISTEMENVSKQPQKIVPVVGIKSFLQATLIVVPEGENTFVRFAGYGPISIANFMKGGEDTFLVRTKYQQKKNAEPLQTVLTFKFIDKDTIVLHVGDPENFYPQFPSKEDVTLYRFYTPKSGETFETKTVLSAKLFRKPSTDSEDWGIISSGKTVVVKEEYGNFYKVEIEGYPDGWLVNHAIEKQ